MKGGTFWFARVSALGLTEFVPQVKDGVLLDSNGQPSNDPRVKFASPSGCLLPFAGHKGYALALMCELIGAAMTGVFHLCEPSFSSHHVLLLHSSCLNLFQDAK